jgi:hypothetical protein
MSSPLESLKNLSAVAHSLRLAVLVSSLTSTFHRSGILVGLFSANFRVTSKCQATLYISATIVEALPAVRVVISPLSLLWGLLTPGSDRCVPRSVAAAAPQKEVLLFCALSTDPCTGRNCTLLRPRRYAECSTSDACESAIAVGFEFVLFRTAAGAHDLESLLARRGSRCHGAWCGRRGILQRTEVLTTYSSSNAQKLFRRAA